MSQLGRPTVDLVVLMDEEFAVDGGDGPLHALGARTSNFDNRFAASPTFISESSASWSRSSARWEALPLPVMASTRSNHALT